MKRFNLVTEADARVLEYGSTIVLAPGGHVTPLAQDTLKARRVAVVADAPDVDLAALVQYLRGRGLAAHDLGTGTTDAVDYPDTAAAVAVQVARGEADAGIVIDGAGLGSCIAANKIAGVRAAMCTNETLARYARQHNGANVLSLGSTLVSVAEAVAIADVFLDTPMREARYIRRLAKIRALEARGRA